MTTDFLFGIWPRRPEGVAHFSSPERKELSGMDLYPVKLAFSNQGEINILLQERKLTFGPSRFVFKKS